MPITATKAIFCAGCQTDTPHTCTPDKNQEIVATCEACARTIKFPMNDALDANIAAHKAANAGQVNVEMAEAEQAVHDEQFKRLMGIA